MGVDRSCRVFVVILVTLTVAGLAAEFPQRGSISGRVLDVRGETISEVTVRLRTEERGADQSVTTDQSGTFWFDELKAASYVLSTEKKYFETVTKKLFLSPNEDHEIEITLPLASKSVIHERVMVIGDPSGISEIPGSAHYIDKEQLDRHKLAYDDVHHFLRQVPGVNIQEEDGYGLRPNIGMRGTGAERSSKITLMEDGVLIAPAPYAAPSAYYFPITGRMEAIEVRKGSSQIKYGPRTTGGALNLISTSIPDDLSSQGNLALGGDSTRKLHLNLGDSYKNIGWIVETYQIVTNGFKQLDGGGETGFDIGDYLAKFRINSDRDSRIYQELEFKLGNTKQISDETYLGLTDADFARNPFRRYRGSQQDVFQSNHEQYQVRYFIVPGKNVDVTTIVYRNNFERNWYKLQSVSGINIGKVLDEPEKYSTQLAIVKGADSDVDTLNVRANNREYYSHGIQTVVGIHLDKGGTQNSLEMGFRYHQDQEDRFQHEDGFQMVNGSMNPTTKGALGSQANRINDAKASALFIQDRIRWGRWSLIPGIRYENINLVRMDFSKNDPNRSTPNRVRKNGMNIFIPGVGVRFNLNPTLGLFGGVHRGFSPPSPGSTENTKAEESLNYEFGFRVRNHLSSLSVAGFINDYDNLLGADTLAWGGTGEGNLFNGGKAEVVGLEASGSFDLGQALTSSLHIPVGFAYTLADAEFSESFESQFEPWGNVVARDQLPYLPRHQFYTSVGLEKTRWRLNLEANSVSRMRTKASQGPLPASQTTNSYLVFNLSGEYDLMVEERRTTLFLGLRNLTDEEYIVARRPAGARPGLPRTLMGGIKFRLGR